MTNADGTVVICEAQEGDAEAIIHYLNVVVGETDFLTFEAGEFTVSVKDEREFITSASSQPNALILVAVAGSRIVGMLTFFGGARERTQHVGEAGVSVLREYWGNGVGTALMNSLIEWARNSGVVRKINGRARMDNKACIHLCEKCGFVQEGFSQRELQVAGSFYDFVLLGLEID